MNLILEFIINFVSDFYYHKKINEFIKKLDIESVIDVGAHKGEFFKSLIKSNYKIKTGLLVEPQESVLKNLKDLKISLPNIRIEIENIALGSKIQTEELYLNSLSSTATLSKINKNSKWFKFKKIILFSNHKNMIKKKKILSDTLDNLMKRRKIDKLDFLKIDTEGYEYEVLKGAINSLKKHRIRHVMLERQLSNMYLNYNFENIEKFLYKNDFIHIKTFRFPLALFEDRIYTLKKK
jgi:FkbM family methyltransferase